MEADRPAVDLIAAAALIGLDIPPQCLPGVAAVFQTLVEHLRNIETPEADG